MKDTETTLRDLITSVISGMGYEFVGCELHNHGRSSVLRVYIDKEAGLTIDDCSLVSRQVSAMLDVEDPIKGKYTLEVSSPGLNRPLFELAQYKRFIGSRIKIRIHVPIENRRNFEGVLLQVKESDIVLSVEETEVELPFTNIEKAKVIADR